MTQILMTVVKGISTMSSQNESSSVSWLRAAGVDYDLIE